MTAMWSDDAEMSALGAMLLSDAAAEDGASMLQPDDFHRPAHRTIFEAFRCVLADGKPLDMVTVATQLRLAGDLESVGGADYLTGIDLFVPSAANADAYFSLVKGFSNRRAAKNSARRISTMADDGETPEAIMAEASSIVDRLSTSGAKVPEVDVRKALQTLLTGKGGTGHATGYPSLDNVVYRRRGGLASKQYTLVSASSGVGKSSLMLSILFRAMKRGERCVFGSFADLDEEEIMYRAVRYANPLGIGRISDARDDAERRSVMDAVDEVYGWAWGLYDASESEGANTVEAFRAWLRKWADKNGAPTRVGLDYAQVIRTSDPKYSGHPTTANQHVSHLVRLMAARYDAAFLVGSQVTAKPDGGYQTKHASDWFDHAASEIQVFRGKLKVTKNRHGPDDVEVPTAWDPVRLIVNEATA